MSTNCYQIAFEHATNELAEINAHIERLTHRKELLEKLLEPLRLLIPDPGSVAIHATVSDGVNTESPASEAAAQDSTVAVQADVPEPEPDPLEAPAPVMQPVAEEANLPAGTIGVSISHEDIAALAYRFWIERGQVHGHHEEDWFRAVHQLENSAG